MATLHFNQILPSQKMPQLAKDYVTSSAKLPKRAKAFCYPFKAAANQGAYFFSPLDFEFKLNDEQFLLRAKQDNGEYKTIEINSSDAPTTSNQFILLSDISPQRSDQCLAAYRERLADVTLPDFINRDNFGFYEILLNVIVEEAPFGVFLQLWLGGVVTTDPGGEVWIKQAANVQVDPGYTTLDALIDVERWQGWLAIVLKPTRKNEWVSVDSEQPVCQLLGYDNPIEAINTIPMAQISDELFCAPLKWHVFDPNYAAKPGKYQRLMRLQPPNI